MYIKILIRLPYSINGFKYSNRIIRFRNKTFKVKFRKSNNKVRVNKIEFKKTINMNKIIKNYPDYTLAVAKALTCDGLILCDIYGSRKVEVVNESGDKDLVDISLFDENVSVENGKYFTLTKKDLEELSINKNQG